METLVGIHSTTWYIWCDMTVYSVNNTAVALPRVSRCCSDIVSAPWLFHTCSLRPVVLSIFDDVEAATVTVFLIFSAHLASLPIYCYRVYKPVICCSLTRHCLLTFCIHLPSVYLLFVMPTHAVIRDVHYRRTTYIYFFFYSLMETRYGDTVLFYRYTSTV